MHVCICCTYTGRFEDAVTLLCETLDSIEQSASAQSDMSKVTCEGQNLERIVCISVSISMQALLVDFSKSVWKW